MENIQKEYLQLIYYIGCALNRKAPDRRVVSETDSQTLDKISEFHKVGAVVGYALMPFLKDRELFTAEEEALWRKRFNDAVRRAAIMTEERKAIQKELDAAGIWYMALKGSVLQDYYPRFGLREMKDVDILFDETKAEQMRDLMVGRGYTVSAFDYSNEDIYEKPPIYEIEMHRTLMDKRFPVLFNYYSDTFSKLKRKDAGAMEYEFTPEDFYIYLIAHDCKHFHKVGIGLRQLADIYIYTSKEKLDRAYIEAELKKINAAEDEATLRRLSELIYSESFDPDTFELTEEDAKSLNYIIDSGADGLLKHCLKNIYENNHTVFYEDSDKGKKSKNKMFNYIKNRVIVPPVDYQYEHPFVYRHKWARPAFYTVRIAKGVIKPRRVIKELKFIKK